MDDMMLPERSVCPRPDAGEDNVGDMCFNCWGYNCNCEEESGAGLPGYRAPCGEGGGGGGEGTQAGREGEGGVYGARGIGPPELGNATKTAANCGGAATNPLAHQLVGGGSPEEGGPLGDGATNEVTHTMDYMMLPERSLCPRPGDGGCGARRGEKRDGGEWPEEGEERKLPQSDGGWDGGTGWGVWQGLCVEVG